MAESTYSQRYAADDSSTAGAFAFDTIAAKDYAVSKLAFGAVGSVTYVSAADPLPVTISGVATAAAQATGNTALAAIQTAVETLDNAVSGVGFNVSQIAGVAPVIATGTPGNADAGLVTRNLLYAHSAGTGNFARLKAGASGDLIVGGSTFHDEAIAGGNPQIVGGYASAAAPANVSADGDAVQAWFLLNGAQVVNLSAGGTLITSTGGSLNANVTNTLTVTGAGGTFPVTGTFWQATQPVSLASLPALAAGTNNIGDVDVLTLPALPAGTNNIGDVDIASIAAGDNNIGNVDIVSGTITTVSTVSTLTGSGVAHDAADSGNPHKIGARARSTDIAAVASDDRTDLIASLLGKSLTLPYALPGSSWSYAAASGGIVNTTGVTAKAAAGVGIRNYVTRVQAINGHATVDTDVQIRDGASGTVLWRGFAKAAGGGCAAEFDPPLRGTANTLIEIAAGTTGSAVYVNLQGYVASE